MSSFVTCSVLQQLKEAGATVIDVMTPEEFALCHLPGAKNACIYEMVFLERVAEAQPDPGAEIVVYDATGTSLAAQTAQQRMTAAGYGKVFVLTGGLKGWREAGLPVETGPGGDAGLPACEDGSYRVLPEKSRVEWIGRNFNNRHLGRVSIESGELAVAAGRPTGGSLVVDMRSIENLDVEDAFWRDLLVRHLKSEDFFWVEEFPTASFMLTQWSAEKGGGADPLCGTVTGSLAIRDIIRPVSFPASFAWQPDGTIKAHAVLEIDRTLWNVRYGSAKYFERLGMHLVLEAITLELFVLFEKDTR